MVGRMIATISADPEDTTIKPCLVLWTGQKSLIKVVSRTYCEQEISASVGIMQLPDKALDRRMICDACTVAYRNYEAQIR